jgi:predicted LPLAT superfamily acyltransferase
VGPYVVSAAAKAPLIHVFAVRRGWRRYSFHGSVPKQLTYTDRRNKDGDLRRFAAEFARAMESFAVAYPYQWGNFFPFWR